MKFIIDSFPKSPKECLFSKRNCEYGYICSLNKKECCISRCDFLLEADTSLVKHKVDLKI